MNTRRTIEETTDVFFSKVNKTETCWLWTGGKTGQGYGSISYNAKLIGVHRFSWMIHNGDIPMDSVICHKCDVPLCVNPKHLFIGTCLDNVHDKMRKGRWVAKGKKTRTEGDKV